VPDGSEREVAASFIERLRSPACYPHPVGQVELLETHISWVLLAGDFAYKVKKPVSLGFVDFTTLESRRFCCEEELRLNRRTAPDLYLEVVPIAGTPESPVMGGEGEAFEYAVRMLRFPQEALLDRVAKAGGLPGALVEDFARSVAAFHGSVAHAGGDGAFGSPAGILAEAVDNFAQLELLDGFDDTRETRQALASWTLREFNRLEPVLARRKHDGFVRECHGDLHLGNVALLDGRPVPFDAIEFNESFRWIDVMNEVAFPVMDLFHHGLSRLAYRFVDAYLDATGDFAGLKVLRFYLVYRAMVRAKVSCIRAHQAGIDAADRERSARAYRGHLDLARRLSRPGTPALIAMHGLSGSGKTTVSLELLEALGGVRLRSDVERKRLHGLNAAARTPRPASASTRRRWTASPTGTCRRSRARSSMRAIPSSWTRPSSSAPGARCSASSRATTPPPSCSWPAPRRRRRFASASPAAKAKARTPRKPGWTCWSTAAVASYLRVRSRPLPAAWASSPTEATRAGCPCVRLPGAPEPRAGFPPPRRHRKGPHRRLRAGGRRRTRNPAGAPSR
jgi:aminoglycoside phosphotransferase family enzyme